MSTSNFGFVTPSTLLTATMTTVAPDYPVVSIAHSMLPSGSITNGSFSVFTSDEASIFVSLVNDSFAPDMKFSINALFLTTPITYVLPPSQPEHNLEPTRFRKTYTFFRVRPISR